MDPNPRRPLETLALAALLALAACGGDEVAAKGPPPNVLVVTIDTLRADHLGCYGHVRDTTPTIDALAAEGVVFEQAFSPMGITFPSHLSLFTGLYPHQHGYLTNWSVVDAPFEPSEGRMTAAMKLRRSGYATAAFVSGPTVRSVTGLDAGFSHFEDRQGTGDTPVERRAVDATETTARVLAWLEESPPEEPFFLWVHYWDPHEPNRPPAPYDAMFEADEALDALLDERHIRPDVVAALHDDFWIARMFAPELLQSIDAGEEVALPPVDRAAFRELHDQYDGDVRHVDDRLGDLFDALRAKGLWDDTIVAVTSDHGQGLGQHDWLGHRRIRSEITRVPLVMRFPDGMVQQPARRDDVASLVDVMPTILARVGGGPAARFREQAEGRDLFSPRRGAPPALSHRAAVGRGNREEFDPREDDEAVAELERLLGPGALDRIDPGGTKYGLSSDRWRLYVRPDGEAELYDLLADPGELVDLADRHPVRVEGMRRALEDLLDRRGHAIEAGAMSDAVREFAETLEGIGYTGE